MSELLNGSCSCGAVSFHVGGEPLQVSWCHCRDCRKQTGAPSVVWAGFRTDDFTWQGQPASRQSSPHATRKFCADCGTPISYEDHRLPGEIYISTGLFDQADHLVPDRHAYAGSKLFWIHLEDGLERFEKTSRGRSREPQKTFPPP